MATNRSRSQSRNSNTSTASRRSRAPNWKEDDEHNLIDSINRNFNTSGMRYTEGWWSIVSQTFNSTASLLRSTEQLKKKWDRMKNLRKRSLRDLTPAEKSIVQSRPYRVYARKINSSTDDSTNIQQSTSQRDPRLRATVQHTTNRGPTLAPPDELSTAQRLHELKIRHMELKVRQAELELERTELQHQREMDQRIQNLNA